MSSPPTVGGTESISISTNDNFSKFMRGEGEGDGSAHSLKGEDMLLLLFWLNLSFAGFAFLLVNVRYREDLAKPNRVSVSSSEST